MGYNQLHVLCESVAVTRLRLRNIMSCTEMSFHAEPCYCCIALLCNAMQCYGMECNAIKINATMYHYTVYNPAQ